MTTIFETASAKLGRITVVRADTRDGWDWTYRVLSGDQICFEGMTRREAMAWVAGHLAWANGQEG